MKKLLLLPLAILLFLSSCKDEEEAPVPPTIMDLEVMQRTASGSKSAERTSAIIHVWKAENREFDVSASPDIHFGYVYDKATDSFETMKYGAIGSRMKEEIEPGRYFVNVLLPKSSTNGSLAYSYTYFDIKEGETLKLKKTFSHDLEAGEYEDWNKNK